jgi:hypothetical protein
MLPPRACESYFSLLVRSHDLIAQPLDVFIGLNGVRVLSIIACLLVFSSSIVTMVDDVEAVNNFIAAGRSNSTSAATVQINCDYVAYVLFLFPPPRVILIHFLATARCPINRLASFGPSSTDSSSYSKSSRSFSPKSGGRCRFSIGISPCLVPTLVSVHLESCSACTSVTASLPSCSR